MSKQENDSPADLLSKRVAKVARVLRITKSGLIIGGSFIIAFAGAFVGNDSEEFQLARIVVILGAIVTLVGGVLGMATDEDPREAIDAAQRKQIEAEKFEGIARKRLEILREYGGAVEQLKSLYMTYSTCRGTIEQALTHSELNEVQLVENCVQGCRHDLRVALGVEMNDYWTVCIYRRELDSNGQPELACVVHQRSVDCDINNARRWPIGVGVSGAALAKNDEVVEPDVFAEAAGTTFLPNENLSRPIDDKKYRSMFAVPVQVGEDKFPWGVVVATSSRANHFGSNNVSGVEREETVRTLAGIVALCVAVCRPNHTEASKQED